MVQKMLKRLIQWLRKFCQRLFGSKKNPIPAKEKVDRKVAPPLTDTDLEFLFTELLAGVQQARGQAWAQNWLHKIEHRVSTERWIEWLERFGKRLLESRTPNNELAARLVYLGELGVGQIGDLAYDIGMQLLTRNQGEPIWEYDGPDTISQIISAPIISPAPEEADDENLPEGEYQTVTLDELFVMLQQDETLRQQIAQQLEIETDDPQVIIQMLINQSQIEE
ncbi:hypothetical protein [Anabaena lutea]|uniref:Uncharacterized protein n=1 Tax=Anabaena lutea FACHB-196 TaxID=2692881 RepID=A0ABR8FFW3_9NOST|nr:hypothetical protein [Anabaena lutea]MBD2568893.1 hypothetical protein [Anabaena lutea FACHB-196]